MAVELRRLRTLMNLAGVSRKEAAGALYLSHSALNRKLRGEISLTMEEIRGIEALCAKKGGKTA
jgi:transcriptional regulator with XRE-family HTH domain